MAEFFPDKLSNRNRYNTEMKKSLIDKAFFLDKVEDSEIFVDFGCADGVLLGFMEKLFPEYTYIGYDIALEELEAAKANTTAKLFSDWKLLIKHVNEIRGDRKVTVICNSLIHEVYSYSNHAEIKEFWEQIYGSGFDYVVIRDMCVSHTTSRPSDIISVAKVHQHFPDTGKLNQFEAEWGGIEGNWALTHFLLKYRYTESWEREVKENYLPLNLQALLRLIPHAYTPILMEHFTLPFIRQRVLMDFGIDLQDRTHIKLILKLK